MYKDASCDNNIKGESGLNEDGSLLLCTKSSYPHSLGVGRDSDYLLTDRADEQAM